jgi:hypothetical protein
VLTKSANVGDAGVGLRHGDLRLQRLERGARLVVARFRRVQRGARDEVLLREVLRAPQRRLRVVELGLALREVGARGLHLGLRLLALRRDVAVLEARDDVAFLDHLAFLHAEPFEAAGALGRHRSAPRRDHPAGRIQHGHRCRRIGGGDGRHVDRHRRLPPAHREARSRDDHHHDQPHPPALPQRTAAVQRRAAAAIDREPRQRSGGRGGAGGLVSHRGSEVGGRRNAIG